MSTIFTSDISNFYVAGINYKKTDGATRGLFAIDSNQYASILTRAPQAGIDSVFILSTCNRTEIYGLAGSADELVDILCSQTTGTKKQFNKLAYIKRGPAAVRHLFEVGAGLDSQLLGDYEIVGQLKHAVKFSKDHNLVNCFLERLVNCVLQASKVIKNETDLSEGSVSVSFSAIQRIKEQFGKCEGKNILLIGTGKIGTKVCKNLIDYLGANHITLINRSEQKAALLASKLGVRYAPISTLANCVAASEIILVATNSGQPVILTSHLKNKGSKLIIDLSIPYNVETSARQLANVSLVDVDELSKLNDDTLLNRKTEVPKANKIIEEAVIDFMGWYAMRKNAASLNMVKALLNKIVMAHKREFNNPETRCPYIAAEQRIQKTINVLAAKMRGQNQNGCSYLQAINDFIFAADN